MSAANSSLKTGKVAPSGVRTCAGIRLFVSSAARSGVNKRRLEDCSRSATGIRLHFDRRAGAMRAVCRHESVPAELGGFKTSPDIDFAGYWKTASIHYCVYPATGSSGFGPRLRWRLGIIAAENDALKARCCRFANAGSHVKLSFARLVRSAPDHDNVQRSGQPI